MSAISVREPITPTLCQYEARRRNADHTVKLWHLQGMLPTFTGTSVSLSPDGKTFAVGNQQGIVTLRQRDGSLLQSFNAHEGEIVKILFHPKGKNLVTICNVPARLL